MIPELFTGEPGWLVLLCLLLGAIYAVLLYFREKKNEFPLLAKTFLGLLRFLAVFLISFMLLAPFLRTVTRVKEKPVIILALDQSQSVVLNSDSSDYRSRLPQDLDELAGNLEKIAETRRYLFGEKLVAVPQGQDLSDMTTYRDRMTDLSGMLQELKDIYDNRNVGALVIASDGIYNTGSNPLFSQSEPTFPIYTLAIGDTSLRRDLLILKVNYNRMVYLDNQYPIEVVVRANTAAGSSTRLRIYQDGRQLVSQDILIGRDDFTGVFQFVLNAGQSGLNKILITLDEIEGELSSANNRKQIFIETLDSRNKILILSSAPHPDISALKQAISSNQNYEVEEYGSRDFRGNLEAFNLVILHQLPSVDDPAVSLLQEIEQKKLPVLFILGPKSDLNRFNQMKTGLNIIASRMVTEEAVPAYNPDFSAFSLNEPTRSWTTGLPPLNSPLGEYQVSNSARVLVNQRLGSVETSRPLIMFNEDLDGRTGVISGDGLWKWRLHDYARNSAHNHFNELVNKTVQYLSVKEQKKQFRIYHLSDFQENQSIEFDAELYNDNYELINDPEIGLTIQNEEGKQFPFVFNKSGNAYHLNAGSFPPGNYSYVAKVEGMGNYPAESGQFSVTALDLEALNTVADHHLLFQLAGENMGKMFFRNQIKELESELSGKEDIKPVSYARKSYEDLINKWWVFGLILLLLSVEWFLRKRSGGY